MIVSKFGGTSMASAHAIKQVAQILQQDTTRQVAVVSAPGKTAYSNKVTELLVSGELEAARNRFAEIIADLQLPAYSHAYLEKQYRERACSPRIATRLSFGEHMSAYILALYLQWDFIDAAEVLHFLDGKVFVAACSSLTLPAVIPGYYGLCLESNNVQTFARGGSDTTGAYLAVAWNAQRYENWTDVSGVYAKDPREAPDQVPYSKLCYDELSTLIHNGAQVFSAEALTPIKNTRIPTVIKNTFSPHDPGTIVA